MGSKYKIGQHVRVKSLDWYHHNKGSFGNVNIGDKKPMFTYAMSEYCGMVLTIDDHTEYEGEYYMIEDDGKYVWADEMFEGVVDESQYHPDMSGQYYSDSEPDNIDDYVHRLKDNECQIALPEGYQFVDRQGNIIDTPLIMVKKKGVKYPKDYDECCEIVGGLADYVWGGYKQDLFQTFHMLYICRDAYWKIAGEEMGLGKPWEPDFEYDIYYIYYDTHKRIFSKDYCAYGININHFLVFPTEEMRDAFFNAFRDDIEKCKELI